MVAKFAKQRLLLLGFFVEDLWMTPFSHVFSCAVRWGDMDAYGHVNHAQFLRYLESARIALFEDLCGAMVALPTLVVAEVRCRYLAELRYPATVTVHSALQKVRGGSLEVVGEIREGERLCAKAQVQLVCFDPVRRRPTRLPPDFLAAIQDYVAD